jgi:hypothetical protein
MWASIVKILSNLTPLSYSLIVLAILAVTLIALKGHIKARFGKKEVELGPDSNDSGQDPILKPPQTVTVIQKRSCGDCILLLMGEREKCEIQMRKESDRILKDQMNFAEQKLIEIHNSFMGEIMDEIHRFSQINSNSVDESVQHKLAYGLFKDALLFVKNEIRRSFKDNGFYELDSTDFTAYVKDRVSVITSMLNQYIRNMFPNKTSLISLNAVTEIVRSEGNSLSIQLNEIYVHAREARIETENKIEKIQIEFGLWIDDFIKPTL